MTINKVDVQVTCRVWLCPDTPSRNCDMPMRAKYKVRVEIGEHFPQ